MTACPSTDARLLLADALQALSDAAGSNDLGAGVDRSSATSLVTGSETVIQRASRVAQEAATEVALAMFLRREGGPHPSGVPPVADFPTPEEIVAGQAAVAAAIGEKGSEQRARACQLATLGMIAKEEALGFWLCGVFRGAFPSSKQAFAIGKRAAERLAGPKEKAKWKEARRKARRAAEVQGAEGDSVAEAGKQAAAAARLKFEQTEVDVGMERPKDLPPLAPLATPADDPSDAPNAAPTPRIDYTNAGDLSMPFWAEERHREIPGYRGRPGGSDDERFWHPSTPPCVPSDERPQQVFGSRQAAEAAGAASGVERCFPEGDEESEHSTTTTRIGMRWRASSIRLLFAGCKRCSQSWTCLRCLRLLVRRSSPRGHVLAALECSPSGRGWSRQ